MQEGSFLFEPWKERVTDIATSLFISKDGHIKILGHHRNISNRAGSFYANLLTPEDPLITPYKEELSEQSIAVAQALYEKGYFGVVGIDSFTYHEGSEEKLYFGKLPGKNNKK